MDNFFYNNYNSAQVTAIEDKEKADAFLKRIEPFKTVNNIDDARALAEKILPTKQDVTSFLIGNLKCIVVNKPSTFRITVDMPEEYICYDFS